MMGGDLGLDHGDLLRFAASQPCAGGRGDGPCSCVPCSARARLAPHAEPPVSLEDYGRAVFSLTREEVLGQQPKGT